MAKRRAAQKTERVEAETVNSVESVEVDPVNLRALVDDVITDYCMRDDLDESDIPPQIWNDIIEEIRVTLFEKNGNLLWIDGKIGTEYNDEKVMDAYDIYKRICNRHCQVVNIKGFLDMTGITKQTLYDWNRDSKYNIKHHNSGSDSIILSRKRTDLAKKIMDDNEQSLESMLQDKRINPMKVLPSLNRHHMWNLPGVSREKVEARPLTADQLPQLGQDLPPQIEEND